MPPQAKEYTLSELVREVAKELGIEKLFDSPEGRGAMASIVNKAIADLETKFNSQFEEERKLRTAAEESVAELRGRLHRRESFDREYGLHRGLDGRLHANVSRESSETLRNLVRALKDKDSTAARALSSGVASEGGVTLQENVATDILRLIPEYGLYPKIARPWPVTTQRTHVGTIMSQMTASWTDDNVTITDSYPGFDKVTLEAKRLSAFIPIPLSLLEDAVIDFGQLVADLIRECVGKEIDRVALVGKSVASGGTDPFDGLVNSPGVIVKAMGTGQTSISNFNHEYLLDMQDSIPEGADEDNEYIYSKSVFNYARKQKDSTGQPIWQRPGDGEPGAIYNCGYHKSHRMPAYSAAVQAAKRFALLGNWKKYALFGMRNELTIATSDVAGDAFEKVQLKVRGTTRVGIASFGPAFAVLETASV
jgi:HK97 family phage major capsid protein